MLDTVNKNKHSSYMESTPEGWSVCDELGNRCEPCCPRGLWKPEEEADREMYVCQVTTIIISLRGT